MPVVVLSATADQQTVLAAVGAGAVGFIPKSSTNEVMQSAVRLVLAGGKYLPAAILPRTDAVAERRKRLGATLSAATLGLTGRQMEVLRLIARGASNKSICRDLELA